MRLIGFLVVAIALCNLAISLPDCAGEGDTIMLSWARPPQRNGILLAVERVPLSPMPLVRPTERRRFSSPTWVDQLEPPAPDHAHARRVNRARRQERAAPGEWAVAEVQSARARLPTRSTSRSPWSSKRSRSVRGLSGTARHQHEADPKHAALVEAGLGARPDPQVLDALTHGHHELAARGELLRQGIGHTPRAVRAP